MKKLLLILASTVVVLASVAGTLAWLTSSTATLDNTFTVGDLTITLEEPGWPEGGNPKIVPGSIVTKDPTVTLEAGSEACFVFMKVEIGQTLLSDAIQSIDYNAAWTRGTGTGTGGNGVPTNVYFRQEAAAPAERALTPLFTTVTFKNTITGERLTQICEGYEGHPAEGIKVTAYAIQSANLPAQTAASAWSMLAEQESLS